MATIQDIAAAKARLKKLELKAELEGSFKAFIRYFFPIVEGPNFIFKEHHLEIIKELELVYEGTTKRLIINIPPGYGKTELVVVQFCAWCYAKTQDCRFLNLSYTSDLTSTNSVKIKDIIATKQFQMLWPTEFSKEINGKEHWKTRQKGEFRAKSTGGAVTGFRAGRMGDEDEENYTLETPEDEGDWLDDDDAEIMAGMASAPREFHGALIIDDPIKPEDAESDVLRNKMNRRMVSTLKSRIMHEDVPVILIMQRVHDDDPAGFMIGDKDKPEEPGGTGDFFKIIKIEAIRKDAKGKEYALWPAKDSLKYLQYYRKAAPYEFESQYQQNPVPDDGIFFQRKQFNRYDLKDIPRGEDFGSCDYATNKDAGDFTELGVFRVTPNGDIYVKDWWSGQESTDIWVENELDLAIAHNVTRWAGETGPIRRAVEPWLRRRMVERKYAMVLDWYPHSEATKEENARGFQALVAAGRVYVPREAPWAENLIDQLCRFPRGKFDDKVDTCSIFAKMINKLWAQEAVKNTSKQKDPQSIEELINKNKRDKARNRRNTRGGRV